ncbi:MAG TPA: PEP/pyruvate-binding domain-containing protein [Gemmataceae bacterium]|nr:PEP/pyruvate-binding domain-containing protein [Gemmataceae bacterium]
MSELRTFEQIHDDDVGLVGGKGLSLGRMSTAGLPVPPGFCVTTSAYRRLGGQALNSDAALVEQIGAAYRQLGSGLVAVRSSATAEDGAFASFAGQQETILGVQGEGDVCAAVARCWDSLHSERAVAYRRDRGVGDEGLAMAVVVQRLVPAEVSGVLFTRDPLDPHGKRMLVEASWGLGESVVSGKVTPDRYHIDRETGGVVEQHIAAKTVQVTAAGTGELPVEKQMQLCLDAARLSELAELGRRIEAFYGEARDVEWAWAEGCFWLLQARPITAAGAAEREQVRREEIAALAARAEASGTVWSRYNIPEGMPEPTPMTWALVSHLLSGRGGCGRMYRDLGYGHDDPGSQECVYDLVAGRPYCNLSREARRLSDWLPRVFPFDGLKANPARALSPQPVRDPSRAAAIFWLLLPLRLPFIMAGSVRRMLRLATLSSTFAARFREEILPAFAAETNQAAAEDWSSLDPPALLERLFYWSKRTLDDYAGDSLKPTALAAIARTGVEAWLTRKLGAERARTVMGELSMGVRPDPEADLAGAIRDLMEGRLDRTAFLERFGHRGPQDMELAQPRWGEKPAALDRLPHHARSGTEDSSDHWEKIAAETNLSALERTALEPQVRMMQTYLNLRETAKHYFMRGYALIRRALVELDKRFGLQGGIFYLTPEELPALASGQDMTELIADRRRRRIIALSLDVPPVLFSDDLEAIGRPQTIDGADQLQGVPLSAGVAEAPALVLDEPRTDNLPSEPYILVCPSTDPAWVPFFVQARGLVMEIGGVLSHGAIVAREYGLPAVAGLPNVQRRLRTGQRVRVDGGSGTVTILPDARDC